MDDSERPTIVTDAATTRGVETTPGGELPPAIGRYRIDRWLGQGGMGTVYAAWDPELDRAVAVKLVRTRKGGDARALTRLQREAQAMAAVAHPNVANVFEVGPHEGGVFIAMELVDGPTLRAWVQESRRSWREVLAMFVQAGKGLAAAHSRGLVHRDFKPTNVLVGNDGRARVLDFGLARAAPTFDSGTRVPIAELDPIAFDEALTVPGAVMGTPAYMAPEQFEGKTVTAASDQFAYCVALWEGLVGMRPFAGETMRELAISVTRGRRRRDPNTALVPAGLLRVIERGFANDPHARWPTMEDLLDRLSPWLRPRRRWWWIGAGVVGVAAIAIASAMPRDDTPCADDASPWSGSERAAVEQALLAAGGDETSTLDDAAAFASAWSTARRELCEAGPAASGGQRSFDLRMACLQRARAQFDAVVELLGREDADVTAHAPALVAGLPEIDECREVDESLPAAALPDDLVGAREASSIRDELARVQAFTDAGAYAEGLERTDALLSRATVLDFAPVLAEATLRRAVLLSRISSPDAEATLDRAFWLGAHAGHDEVAMEASLELAWLVGYVLGRVDEGLAWARHAEAAMERLGMDPSRSLSTVLGPIHYQAGNWEEARVHLERELAIDEERYGPAAHQTAMSRMNLANLDLLRGDVEDACREFERAADDLQNAFPDGHISLATALVNAGSCRLQMHDHDAAEPFYSRGVAVYEAMLGADHPDTAEARELLGNLYSLQGRHEAAMQTLERAAAANERATPESRLRLRATTAAVILRAGDVAGAETRFRSVLADIDATLGVDHELAGFVHDALGSIAADAGRLDAARDHYAHAHAIDVARHGAEHPESIESGRKLASVGEPASR